MQQGHCGAARLRLKPAAMLVLRASSIHGVGIFTTQTIAKGDHVRLWQEGDYRFVTFAESDEDPDLREVREIYCVKDGKGYHCPADFHRMSIGWYMNHSDTPNVRSSAAEGWEYYATRAIEAGEEIVCDYTSLTPYESAPDG